MALLLLPSQTVSNIQSLHGHADLSIFSADFEEVVRYNTKNITKTVRVLKVHKKEKKNGDISH